ncbi:oxidoreductase [Staphylococcus canis]|uniref:2-dehydropantoate 2-reductase n=1 Tax=Staphylococcus canis TaxID=2724942 RepID=A0ABS0TB93_9STAP|nr:oxidoreductase [Staphylococcus canis]MBI5975028.1 oxidoreductase [Staphylococcus canis]
MTKIAIIGPGAVGTSLAVALQDYPHVTLLGRRATTLIYEEAKTSETQSIAVQALPKTTERYDVIFIAVKTYQLDSVLPYLPHMTHDKTCIILAQNGYQNLQQFAPYRVYQAVVYISGQKQGNHVTHFRDQVLHIQRDHITEQLAETLAHTQLILHLENEIEHKIWYKLLVNLGINTITALSRDTAQVLKNKAMVQLCEHLLQEGVAIAQHEGIPFSQSIVKDIMKIYQGYPDQMGTSMYYDIINNQPLEVDAIQGYIYRAATRHQLKMPYIEMAYTLLSHHHQNALQLQN